PIRTRATRAAPASDAPGQRVLFLSMRAMMSLLSVMRTAHLNGPVVILFLLPVASNPVPPVLASGIPSGQARRHHVRACRPSSTASGRVTRSLHHNLGGCRTLALDEDAEASACHARKPQLV